MRRRYLNRSVFAQLLPLAVGALFTLAPLAARGASTPGDTPPRLEDAAEPAAGLPAAGAQQEQTFTIKRFVIEGSSLFAPRELEGVVSPFVGRHKSSADVEGARDALERFFHDQGYPTVVVNIPEQAVQNKVIRLDIIENRVGSVTVTGNRWFSTEKILRELPSIAPGQVINLQQLQLEANRLNRNPDFKLVPGMQPGKAPESVDMSIKVTDERPLHGSLELNNRSSHDTTDLRLSASLRYDNLWQREHSISAQGQMSPQDPGEVLVASGSYTLPAPWDRDDKAVLYGVWSNSDTATAAGFTNLGKGIIVGTRVILPLRGVDDYSHTAVLGVDYKDFEETVGLAGSEQVKSPISYFPFSAAYSSSLRDGGGATMFNAALNLSFRGAVADPRQFEDKRFKARGNYLFLTAGVERSQALPREFSLLLRLDGQWADQPLISNEQYVAGGAESVRGYHESEASGDKALHGVFELSAPDLLRKGGRERFSLAPYLFYEGAGLWVKDPLPGQERRQGLQGTGLGLRGRLFGSLEFQSDLGFALMDTGRTAAGDPYLHFKVKWQF
ncbi:MAG: peptidase S33 [Geobacteraceae bacterium GWC2_58_44]|nr:MAG: peptidase S33 [Geobacteraceae bacterium GWC2_58_44]HBG04799.1 ShlB/FhaC/HecB family hemolysin secretion/activation protein [Geobacter sp.]